MEASSRGATTIHCIACPSEAMMMPTCAALIEGQKMALTWPYLAVRKALSPTAHQRKK
jgi:hypothetical protein